MTTVFHDFEYRDDGRQIILGCFRTETERLQIDFRDVDQGRKILADFVARHQDAWWLPYSGMAEMGCMLRLGIDIRPLKWIDLMVEARQITGTHKDFYAPSAGLLDSLAAFGIVDPDRAHKDRMRDLILASDQYTPEEWADIVKYCWSDIDALPELMAAIMDLHEAEGTGWTPKAAQFRAEYVKASALLDHRTQGLPIDTDWLDRIFTREREIRNALAEMANQQYGQVFLWNPIKKDYHFWNAGLEKYIATLPYEVEWDYTDAGRQRRMDSDYFSDLVRRHKEFLELKRIRDTLNQLKSTDLRDLERDGFIKSVSIPFYTKTGRNQPLVKRGFVLNMAPWLRVALVRPKPGYVLIAADWSKQEIGVAAAFTQDPDFMQAYLSADIYISLAQMAGLAPEGASEETHGLERQCAKSMQLGLGYGMGLKALGRNIWCDINEGKDTVVMDLDECQGMAREIYSWHRATFRDYWRWLEDGVREARSQGFVEGLDGWCYFVDRNVSPTQLLNLPVQSAGAAMLREAIKDLAFNHPDIDIPCSLHDALYAYCRIEDAERVQAVMQDCMDRATRKIVGDVPIRVGWKVFTHESGFKDGRAKKTFGVISDLLNKLDQQEAA